MKTRKLTAILLALCMLLSLSISAFAADDAIASGTIQDSKITWKLDDKGWLTISGSGDCSAFASKDDQPWAEYRSQITQVWFDGMESLAISDLAYWFEDCTNLTTAEIPSTTPVIGRHAFYNCPLLTKLSIYYGEHTLDSIGEDAFWRETDNGDTLYVAYIIGYPDSSVPFHDYDWIASNRSNRYFHDLYGVYQNADAATAGGIKKAPAQVSTRASTGIVGTCPSCKQYSLQGTYVEQTHTSRGHQEYYECYKCHYVKNLGTYVYKEHGDGSYGSWTCPSCGSHTWVLDYQSDATCTSNGYRSYSCACGQTKSETIYASGHSYSYGSWEEYSSSQHRREAYCRNCGASSYDYASHSLSYGSWSNDSSSQHSRTVSCRTCGYSTTDYGSHSYSTGPWSKYSDTQHRRSKTCSGCGATDYDYANHSYSYGNWSKYDETQHRRTKTCSACSDSDYEYGDHRDSNADGVCDDCGANVALIVTWDAASNGGTVGGKNSVTTSVAPNQTAVAPGYTPVKAGHTFSGWYTEKAGGALYSTVTITAARTFYAQFTPAEYKITWDLGTGKTETTNQTYGEKLNLPTEPTRRGYAFLGWFTQETGGTQVDGNTVFKEAASTTYYAHWEEATVFSVVVPAVLPVTVDQNGKVYVSNAEIVNHSTAAVQVSSVTLTAENGWTLVPYASDMSHAKVDSNQIGFKINSAQTSKTGSTEQFELTSPWQINEEESLTLTYDAVVSALSQPVTNANILCVLFVVEWAYLGVVPTLQDFHAALLEQPEPEARDVALALELFTEGSLNTFAKYTNVDTNSRILCYDIRDLGKQLLPVGMLVVLDSVFNRIIRNRKLGKNTWLYIDEIYLLFQHEYSANFLFTLWKRMRKYGACGTGLTQNVDDLLQSHTARTMLANSEFLLMLNQASTDRIELARLLNISDNQLSYISGVDFGHGLLKCGSTIVPFVDHFPKNGRLYQLMTTKMSERVEQAS